MKVKARVSFSGNIVMGLNEVRDVDASLALEYIECGFLEVLEEDIESSETEEEVEPLEESIEEADEVEEEPKKRTRGRAKKE